MSGGNNAATKKSNDKKKKNPSPNQKDPQRKKDSKKKADDAEEKNMMKFLKKLKELSEDDFIVETVSVPLQTFYESKIKLTVENTVSGAPLCATMAIDLGDQVLAINGKKVANREESRIVFRDIKREVLRESSGKKVDFEVQITRRRLRRLKISQMPKMLVSEDLPKGFEVYEALLVLYPNSSIGFNVKAGINQRCMVSSVDGGWKSVAKKVFQVGDILLYIAGGKDGQEVNSVFAAKTAIVKFATGAFIRMWFARAKDPICVKQVRAALIQDKIVTSKDPRMTADCLDIVKDELTAMDYRKTKKMTFPEVVKDYNEHEKKRIAFRKSSKFVRIGVEAHVNPHHLSIVPAREKKKPQPAAIVVPSPPLIQLPTILPPIATFPPMHQFELIKNNLPKKKKLAGKNKSKDSKEEKGSAEKAEQEVDSSRKKSKKNGSNEDDKNVKSNYVFEDMNKNAIVGYKVDIFPHEVGAVDGSAKKDSNEAVGIDSSSTKDNQHEKPKN